MMETSNSLQDSSENLQAPKYNTLTKVVYYLGTKNISPLPECDLNSLCDYDSSCFFFNHQQILTVNPRDTTLVNIHETASVDSPILGTAGQGDTITVTSEIGDWVSLNFKKSDGIIEEGWVLRRFGDQIYLISSSNAKNSITPARASQPTCNKGHLMMRTSGIPGAYR